MNHLSSNINSLLRALLFIALSFTAFALLLITSFGKPTSCLSRNFTEREYSLDFNNIKPDLLYGANMVVDKDGFIYISGLLAENGFTTSGVYIIRASSEASVICQNRILGTANISWSDIAVDTRSNVYLCGTATAGSIFLETNPEQKLILPNPTMNAFLIKLSPDNNLLFTKSWSGREADSILDQMI